MLEDTKMPGPTLLDTNSKVSKERLLEAFKAFSKMYGKDRTVELMKNFHAKKFSEIKEVYFTSLLNHISTYGCKHSLLSPSGSSRWINCTSSVQVEQAYGDNSSDYAIEGTNGHTLFEYSYLNNVDPYHVKAEDIGIDTTVDDRDEKIRTIPVDMPGAVQIMLDTVKEYIDDAGGIDNCYVFIEKKMSMRVIYEGMFGTGDCVIYDKKNKKIIVIDYKHGQGVKVDVKDCTQLIIYLIGAFYENNDMIEGYDTGEIVIVQPRAGGKLVTRQKLNKNDVKWWVANLKKKAKKALSPEVGFKAGEHCLWCKHSANCEKRREIATEFLQFDDDGNVVAVEKYSMEELGKLHVNHEKYLKPYFKQVYAVINKNLSEGREVPGLCLVPKRGTRKWVSEVQAIKALEKLAVELGIDAQVILTQPKLKSPAQVEKALSVRKDKTKDLTHSVSTGYNVAIDKEGVEKVTCKNAAEIFGKI